VETRFARRKMPAKAPATCSAKRLKSGRAGKRQRMIELEVARIPLARLFPPGYLPGPTRRWHGMTGTIGANCIGKALARRTVTKRLSVSESYEVLKFSSKQARQAADDEPVNLRGTSQTVERRHQCFWTRIGQVWQPALTRARLMSAGEGGAARLLPPIDGYPVVRRNTSGKTDHHPFYLRLGSAFPHCQTVGILFARDCMGRLPSRVELRALEEMTLFVF